MIDNNEMLQIFRRRMEEAEAQNAQMRSQLESLQKGEDPQIKAMKEAHSTKVKTLVSQITNLKKEMSQGKFESKDNVRI